MSFAFSSTTPRRRPSLTAMIDVVFLLLVFFMLAARFGQDGALPLSIGTGGGNDWQGPPRLVAISPDGLRLNGQEIANTELEQALSRLTETSSDPILLLPDTETSLQRLMDTMSLLEEAGFDTLVLVNP